MSEEAKEHHEHAKKEEQHQHDPAHAEKKDLRDGRISVVVFALAGVAMALASSVLNPTGLSNYITATIALIFLVAMMAGMQKAFKRKFKFFLTGAFAYIFIWLMFWIFLYNM
jgi:cation transport ATPase